MTDGQVTLQQITDFNKFARFISKKFDVHVVLDGTSAMADSHRTIYLPNLSGMSSKDVDFMYKLLTHEIGHIVYSDYSDRMISRFISEGHQNLVNALEDARMENCMMLDYDGAIDMFDSLYNDYAHDKKYMHKVFGFDIEKSSEFHYIGIYLHMYLLKIPTKPAFEKIYGKKNAQKVDAFIKKYNIEKIITTMPFVTADDAVDMSIPIYEAIVKEFKDRTEKIKEKAEKMLDAKDEAVEMGERMQNELKSLLQNIEDVKKRVEHIKEQALQDRKKRVKDSKEARMERNQIAREIAKESEKIHRHQDAQRARIDQAIAEGRKQKFEAKKNEINRKLTELENKIEEAKKALTDPNLKPKQKPVVEKRIERLEKQEKRMHDQIDNRNAQISKQQSIANQKKREKEHYEDGLDQKVINEAREKISKLNEDLQKASDKLKESEKMTPAEIEYSNAEKTIKQANDDFESKAAETIANLEKSLRENGLPTGDLPGFEENEEWPEMDQVQQEFDHKATKESGKVVNNGAGMNLPSPRDIMSIIDSTVNDVVEFSVMDYFQDKINDDKIKTFFEDDLMRNTVEDGDVTQTYATSHKHVPLTEKFDKVTVKNRSNGMEINKIANKNFQTVTMVKRAFKNRLKFSRKDSFKGNQEEGKLDSRSVWKIATGTSRDGLYFEKTIPKFVNKLQGSIVIDISGSNDKDYTSNGLKIKELAHMLSEGLKEVHVKHEILGVHAPLSIEMRDLHANNVAYNRTSNSLETIVYKNFDDKSNNGLQNMQVECSDNSDGESLRIAAKRLLKRPAKARMLFYIFDGKPFLTDSNLSVLDQDLRNAIDFCKSHKIKLYGFGFNKEGKKFFGDSFCHVKQWADVVNFIQTKM